MITTPFSIDTQAWSLLGGVISVSQFLQDYLCQWMPSGLSIAPTDKSLEMPELCSPALSSSIVVPLSAWNCFGSPPFPDFGTLVASRKAGLEGRALGEGQAFSSNTNGPTENHQSAALPEAAKRTVGVMKLTPEKGCSIVLELARTMPHLHFLAVAGDPRVAEMARGIPNLEVRHIFEMLWKQWHMAEHDPSSMDTCTMNPSSICLPPPPNTDHVCPILELPCVPPTLQYSCVYLQVVDPVPDMCPTHTPILILLPTGGGPCPRHVSHPHFTTLMLLLTGGGPCPRHRPLVEPNGCRHRALTMARGLGHGSHRG